MTEVVLIEDSSCSNYAPPLPCYGKLMACIPSGPLNIVVQFICFFLFL